MAIVVETKEASIRGLRQNFEPVLQLPRGQTITAQGIRPAADTHTLIITSLGHYGLLSTLESERSTDLAGRVIPLTTQGPVKIERRTTLNTNFPSALVVIHAKDYLEPEERVPKKVPKKFIIKATYSQEEPKQPFSDSPLAEFVRRNVFNISEYN